MRLREMQVNYWGVVSVVKSVWCKLKVRKFHDGRQPMKFDDLGCLSHTTVDAGGLTLLSLY